MAVEFTQEVSDRLNNDQYGWLTTIAKSGQPVPKLVWFYFDGSDVIVYSEPGAAKVRHIRNHPRVSLNLDSDGNGAGVIVVGGTATIDAENANPLTDDRYRAKYGQLAATFGFSEEFLAAYNTRVRINVDKVWTTPTEG
ncbi:TIGR03667 family PPOX class F420-dependent oxidoreductase [Mycobacterium deserti]|uniref:TIGR03667 family PPOX class F420-dependent oxidoreductase n=1 Tax=Mycobacterium deserti TaxID=2978347 RepID=A0ABT2MEQ2_9MYCO|nr:TIGR03667 family PPOX class F420-dependent oxidoreductase [Mycobacterium deserti]MCT7660758.1 TIGR03667 family PPOX class F420-dependent oxidoreductase [Mycobacterium deserti]